MASSLQGSVATAVAPRKLWVDVTACRREGGTIPMKRARHLAFTMGRVGIEQAGISVIMAAPAQVRKRARFVEAERLVRIT